MLVYKLKPHGNLEEPNEAEQTWFYTLFYEIILKINKYFHIFRINIYGNVYLYTVSAFGFSDWFHKKYFEVFIYAFKRNDFKISRWFMH